jgi:hypothetical protein
MKTLSILSILLLTLSLPACSYRYCETTDQNTEASNEPCENDASTDQPTHHTYQTCPEVSACDGVEADCSLKWVSICGEVAKGEFYCGNVRGSIFSNGAEFPCDDGGTGKCACSIVDAADYCASLEASQ